jgi:FAD/FMN-containing dehydrogenase
MGSAEAVKAIDRRTFLRLGAGAVAALGAGARTPASAVVLPGLRRAEMPTTIRSSPVTLAGLASALDGRLVLPSSARYKTSRLVYDLRYASDRPLAIAYCSSPVDVARCLEFATAHHIAPIPRSGGHSYGGYSTGSGLIIDVSAMNRTNFSPGSALVGAGTSLADLYGACAKAGALIPGGSCPTVGISGLALGGGVGVLSRKFGLTCDNVREIEIVTADGKLLRCNEESHADLFWACRGGGGRNFGVVTTFGFTTHRIPQLSIFTVDWPWARAPEVLREWQRWMAGAPDELWSNCQLLSAGSAGRKIRSTGVFVGTVTALEGHLNAFVAASGPPTSRFIGSDSYLKTMLIEAGCDGLSLAACRLAAPGGPGTLQRAMFNAKSAYGAKVMTSAGAEAAVNVVDRAAESAPDAGAALIFDAYGGAINTVHRDATAFVHRDALFGVQMTLEFGPDANPATIDAHSGWLEQAASAIAPSCNGEAYQNYIDPTLKGWQKAYYGTNLTRLSTVKHRYDPDDVFTFAQSIPPKH